MVEQAAGRAAGHLGARETVPKAEAVSADAIMQLIVGLALLVGVGLGMHVRRK